MTAADQTPATDSERVEQIRASAQRGWWAPADDVRYLLALLEEQIEKHERSTRILSQHSREGRLALMSAEGEKKRYDDEVARLAAINAEHAEHAATIERVRGLHAGEVLSSGEVSIKVCPTCGDAVWPCKSATALGSQRTEGQG